MPLATAVQQWLRQLPPSSRGLVTESCSAGIMGALELSSDNTAPPISSNIVIPFLPFVPAAALSVLSQDVGLIITTLLGGVLPKTTGGINSTRVPTIAILSRPVPGIPIPHQCSLKAMVSYDTFIPVVIVELRHIH
ncbi:hypothetical protein NM688_g308 [Phlebia brevispora]|uniref:Uncharacterized protein n=1 Tax=Phlebia brevispora TaxID=194682 RepID=A0ACC1TEV2_9APHY|nr:hypothetical protein NM688_g308 [Phlebia brevispora]